jgi:acyl-CoA thioesterase
MMLDSTERVGTTAFQRETAVSRSDRRPDAFDAHLSDSWNAPLIPHGGVVTAVGLRAMEEVLDDPELRLRSVTTVFVAQVHPGPVEVDVEILRRGRSMSHVRAVVRNRDAEHGHELVAVFGRDRRGFEFTELTMPDAPPPMECRSWRECEPEVPPGVVLGPRATFWEQVESRLVAGHFPWEEWTPSTSERVYWYRFHEPPLIDGILDPFAVVALCDTMPGAVHERVGPLSEVWLPPSVDLTVHYFGDTSSEWLLVGNRASHAGDGYASLEIDLWDPAGVPLARATQVCFFTFPEPAS